MKTKLYSAIAGAALIAASGLAMAETPLTTSQMDDVTASGVAYSDAFSAALGGYVAFTYTYTDATVAGVVFLPVQVGGIWVVGTSANSYAEAFASN